MKKKSIYLKPGKVNKGFTNTPPTTPRPASPKGQDGYKPIPEGVVRPDPPRNFPKPFAGEASLNYPIDKKMKVTYNQDTKGFEVVGSNLTMAEVLHQKWWEMLTLEECEQIVTDVQNLGNLSKK